MGDLGSQGLRLLWVEEASYGWRTPHRSHVPAPFASAQPGDRAREIDTSFLKPREPIPLGVVRSQSFVSVDEDATFSDAVLAVLVSVDLLSPPFFSLDMACLRDSEG